MNRKHGCLAVVAATMLLMPTAQADGFPQRVASMRHDPQFILEAVAQRMGIRLRPEISLPALHFESLTPLHRLQVAAERQWGFRPHVFVSMYAAATNEIYLVDDPTIYARYKGSPDDSLAHEFVHYFQANYRNDPFTTDWLESEAVAIQTWFRSEFMNHPGMPR